MKSSKIIALLAVMIITLSCCLCGCTNGGKTTTTVAPTTTGAPTTTDAPTTTVAPTPTQPDAETAMNNFVKKLQAGNYVVKPDSYLMTNVFSPEQITLLHDEDSTADEYAFITLNGETFNVLIEFGVLTDVAYSAPSNAIEAMGFLLPNYWITASENNMFNLFYNNVNNPLEFTSNDDIVKTTLLGLGGYNKNALDYVEEVTMLFDAEDPTSVRFTAHIGETGTMVHYNDIDLTLQFGAGTSDPRVEKWLKNPVYPPSRTGWDDMDIAMLDNVFLKDYGTIAVPFPKFTSYALIFDPNAYLERTEVLIKDAHATEKDVEEYKKLLLANGYKAVEEDLGNGTTETVYRLLLRKDYNAYAELYPYFDNGFVLRGGMHYEDEEYDGLDAINSVIVKNGFAALPETDIFTGWKAVDYAFSRSEGWAYYFDYNLYMPFILEYKDFDEAQAYFDAYGKLLADKGFSENYSPGMNRGEYSSPNGFIVFRYTFDTENTVILEFKNEKSLTVDEVRNMLAEHNMPPINIHGVIGARDNTRYQYNISGFKGLVLNVYQMFDTRKEAEDFLDDYTAVLEENGYEYTDPQAVGSNRSFLFLNMELAKYVAFDLFDDGAGSTIFFQFYSIEPDEDSILESTIRR